MPQARSALSRFQIDSRSVQMRRSSAPVCRKNSRNLARGLWHPGCTRLRTVPGTERNGASGAAHKEETSKGGFGMTQRILILNVIVALAGASAFAGDGKVPNPVPGKPGNPPVGATKAISWDELRDRCMYPEQY